MGAVNLAHEPEPDDDDAGPDALLVRCPRLTETPPPKPEKTGWPWTEESLRLSDALPDGQRWPRVSIVITSYNQGEFLEEALRSVLLQGYPNIECVVIDGGSIDVSVEVLERYAPWLAYWCSEPDGGTARALNKGFKQTTGAIVGYLGSDDFYLPGCVEAVVRAMLARRSADVVYGNGYFAGQAGRLEVPIVSDRWSLRRFASGACILVQQATFLRRDALETINGFNEANRTCWDAELCVDLALAGAEFQRIGGFLAAYRLHRDSITGRGNLRSQFRKDLRRIFEKVVGRPETTVDRLFTLALRLRKFSAHPLRTLRYKRFYRSALGRWSL